MFEGLLKQLQDNIADIEAKRVVAEKQTEYCQKNAEYWYQEHNRDHWRVIELEKRLAGGKTGEPQMKSNVAVTCSDAACRHILFYADDPTTTLISHYGSISGKDDTAVRVIFVDARYDFDEVLDWIKGLA